VSRPIYWIERALINERRLEQNGKMGVVAVEFVRTE
jgi:hypothetical protein